MKKSIFLMIIALLFTITSLKAQEEVRTMVTHLKNGNAIEPSVADIDSITFCIKAPNPKWVEINGVKWAEYNVDMPGAFAANPEDAGMFYQWNCKIGWSSTDSMVNSNGGTTWDSSILSGTTWEPANDPSPPGYRVPTKKEIESLLNTTYVTNVWTTENGVSGRQFTDNSTGESIFLPAAGSRNYSDGTLSNVGTNGYYWSSPQNNASNAYGLYFSSSLVLLLNYYRSLGFSVRPVAE